MIEIAKRRMPDARCRWAAAAAVAGVAAGWLFGDRAGVAVPADVTASVPSVVAATGSVQVTERSAPRVSSPDASTVRASAPCGAQRFDVAIDGRIEPACVGATQVVQNGSLRGYRVDAQGEGSRWLVIDTAGSRVVSATLGQGDAPPFECRGDACAGIVVGAADLQGMRRITLDGARLSPREGVGSDVVLFGRLVVAVSGEDGAGGTCEGQGVLISRQDAAPLNFYPDDGSSIDGADAGYVTYSFLSLDGESIRVSLDAEGRLHRVAYGTRSCTDTGCTNVSIAPAAQGGRTLDFGGTLVQTSGASAGPGTWATLTGRLLLP